MKKRMKKWLGCAAAAIMVIAMGATGFARDCDNDQNLSFFGGSGTANVGVHSTGQTLGNTVSFDKVILVEDGGTEGVDEPYVKWKYTIRPVLDDGTVDTINAGLTPDVAATYKKGTTTISDGTNTILVEPGQAAQITGGTEKTAEFKADTYTMPTAVITAPNVQTFTKTVSFSFDTTKFTKAGVYRFVIKESDPEGANKDDVEDTGGKGENGAAGQQDVPYQRERFLDVYVRSKDNAGVITYEIYGYVMHSGDTDKDNNANGNKWAQHKNSGFDGGKQKGNGKLTPQGYTKYTPRKVKIKKKISGLVPTDTLFPFTIQLLHGGTTTATNDNKDMEIKVKYPGFTPTAPNAYQIMSVDDFNAAVRNLKHDDEVEIIGLPKSTTVVVKEQNKNFVGAVKSDLTGYKSIDLIDANKDTSITAATKVLKPDATSTDPLSFSDEVSKQLTNNDLGLLYHNHVDEITPTGVVLTVVPYAMMIFVSISMAFMFLTKRKEE